MIKKFFLSIFLSMPLLINAIPKAPNDIPGSIQINWALVKHRLTVCSVMATVGSIAFYPIYCHIKNRIKNYLAERFRPTFRISEADLARIKERYFQNLPEAKLFILSPSVRKTFDVSKFSVEINITE